MKRTLLGAVICACTVPAPPHLRTQVPTQSTSAWRVDAPAHAGLWFHGLAVIGFEGFAPLSLYSAE